MHMANHMQPHQSNRRTGHALGDRPVTMPAPPAMTQPADPAQRRRVITITAIVGACILLGIVYGVVNSTVFSAKSVANSYLSSIAAGRFSEATNLADPHLNGNKAALLTDKAAGGANTTIYNQRITSSARQPDGSTQLGISYMLGTRTYTSTLTMTPSGSKFLLFRNWHINTPLLTTMSLQVPQAAGTRHTGCGPQETRHLCGVDFRQPSGLPIHQQRVFVLLHLDER